MTQRARCAGGTLSDLEPFGVLKHFFFLFCASGYPPPKNTPKGFKMGRFIVKIGYKISKMHFPPSDPGPHPLHKGTDHADGGYLPPPLRQVSRIF